MGRFDKHIYKGEWAIIQEEILKNDISPFNIVDWQYNLGMAAPYEECKALFEEKKVKTMDFYDVILNYQI